MLPLKLSGNHKKYRGLHYDIFCFCKLIKIRFWVKFLIGQFIPVVKFLFDWDVCGEYLLAIAQVDVA